MSGRTLPSPAVPGGDAEPGCVPGYRAEDVAAADEAVLATGADLMSVAAAALAAACLRRLREARGRAAGARAVLLVGAGNNGGDALLAGALLVGRGVGVTALLCAPHHHEAGAAALRRAGGRLLAVTGGPQDGDPAEGLPPVVAQALRGADLVVDGLLGIGARGAARGAGGVVLQALLDGPRPACVVACDLPSGLDPDTGRTAGPVLAAEVTVTFGAAKQGLLLPWATPLVGRLQVVDLGLGPHLPAVAPVQRLVAGPGGVSVTAAREWPRPAREADKYSRGVLGVVAGELAYPGAAVLACSAAVSCGPGMVRYVPPDGAPDVGRLVLQRNPEVVVQPLAEVGRVQAWVAGPGTGGGDDDRLDHVLTATDEPAVVDAGGLAALARALAAGTLRAPHRLLLTPHAGELDRLLDALGAPTVAEVGTLPAVRGAAARTGATVLLKGADTMVVSPDGATVVVPGGPAWLATAGAGDVLAGVAGTLLAAGLAPARAGVLAAHVHAVAARRTSAGGPLRAGAVADALPVVLHEMLSRPPSWDHG